MPRGATCAKRFGHFNSQISRSSKGGPEGGKTPEETSLLETCGETDVLAEVVIGRIPLD
jgi:hypothetical protein